MEKEWRRSGEGVERRGGGERERSESVRRVGCCQSMLPSTLSHSPKLPAYLPHHGKVPSNHTLTVFISLSTHWMVVESTASSS